MITIKNLIGGNITITTKPATKAETHIKFVDGTKGDYLIKGTMDCPALVAAGLMPPGSGTEMAPSWNKDPMEVEIGSAVTSIGASAFDSRYRLTSVTIPDSVTSIGRVAFYDCRSLTSVTIPSSVTIIEDRAFIGCTGFTNVTIPDSVTSVGENAFENCYGLTSVTFSGKDKATVQGMANHYWGLGSGCVIHCTDGDITL